MTEFTCTQEGCQISSSGKCLEGFDPIEECPYAARAIEAQEAGTASQPASNFIDLPTGEALTSELATEVMREQMTRLIILAGPVGSGKTTILTSLFESFLEAPVGNFLFAGSRTLVGFERRCHDARITSGRTTAQTTHTSMQEGIVYFHLKLAILDGATVRHQNLLLSDFSGEAYTKLRDSTHAVHEMKAFKRADDLYLVIDGEKLIDSLQRHVSRTDARTTLRSLIEAGALSPICRIGVIFSKWDLVLASGSDSAKDYIAETRRNLQELAGAFGRIDFFEVAARPENKLLPFAHGIPTLLRAWLQQPDSQRTRRMYLPEPDHARREISRFPKRVASASRLTESYDVRWI